MRKRSQCRTSLQTENRDASTARSVGARIFTKHKTQQQCCFWELKEGKAQHSPPRVQEMALSPWMFTRHVPKNTIQKGSQWAAFSRAAAYAVAYDRIVEPWFATFAGAHWRCAYLRDAPRALDGIAAMEDADAELAAEREDLVATLQRAQYLPVPFTQGALWPLVAVHIN